jgi:hypothetical protein
LAQLLSQPCAIFVPRHAAGATSLPWGDAGELLIERAHELPERGTARARSHCRFGPPTHPLHTRFAKIIGSFFLNRRCDRTLGAQLALLATSAEAAAAAVLHLRKASLAMGVAAILTPRCTAFIQDWPYKVYRVA